MTTPCGVSIASATQSGMLCVTRRNSTVNDPICTRSRGFTRRSLDFAALSWSSNSRISASFWTNAYPNCVNPPQVAVRSGTSFGSVSSRTS